MRVRATWLTITNWIISARKKVLMAMEKASHAPSFSHWRYQRSTTSAVTTTGKAST